MEKDNMINELQRKFEEKCKEFNEKLVYLNGELITMMKKMRS
jgi:hypothetical protein